VTGEHRANDADVLEHRTSTGVDWSELRIRSDAGELERMALGRKRLVGEPVVAHGRLDWKAEQRLLEATVRPTDQPAPGDPTRCEDDRPRPDAAFADSRRQDDGGGSCPIRLDPHDGLADRQPTAASKQGRP
jgi:hypothetical protein